jgi:hypothetical protein
VVRPEAALLVAAAAAAVGHIAGDNCGTLPEAARATATAAAAGLQLLVGCSPLSGCALLAQLATLLYCPCVRVCEAALTLLREATVQQVKNRGAKREREEETSF